MSIRAVDKSPSDLTLGDKVRIKNYDGAVGKVIELRGALGPNGMKIFRVRVNKSENTFIELREDQLEYVPIIVSRVKRKIGTLAKIRRAYKLGKRTRNPRLT